jgi:hypothetical protein
MGLTTDGPDGDFVDSGSCDDIPERPEVDIPDVGHDAIVNRGMSVAVRSS